MHTWAMMATAALSLFIVVLFVLDLWLILTQSLPPRALGLVLGVQCVALIALAWALYTLLELRVLRPLRRLEDHFRILAHTDSNHQLQLPNKHFLGALAECAEEVGRSLVRERNETARAMESAAQTIDHRKARLEAILRDLTEGVVVCSLEHRIVLFNQAAIALLQDAGALGLHRSVLSLFEGNAITQHLNSMLAQYRAQNRVQIGEFECRLVGNRRRRVAVRMNLIIEPGAACSGYVLSLAGKGLYSLGGGPDIHASVLTDRPEFYDFSLFDRDTFSELSTAPLRDLDYVVFDTETTGLNPSKGDEIVQISGVRVVNGRVLDSDHFDLLVNPGFPIPKQSIRFHGITDDMVLDAPSVCDALRRFHTFVDDAILVAHNAAFDMKFLKLKERMCDVSFDSPVLDTLLLSLVLQPSHSAHTLDAIATRFGVEIPMGLRHTALGDAQATADIFVKMLIALDQQGTQTLQEAVVASNKVFEMRRLQSQF